MAWDPGSGITFGQYMREKGVHVRPGWTWATRDQVTTGHRVDGVAVKHTVDQLGHEVTEHADGRRDVTINMRS